jgi:hypothetical protein
MFLLLLVSTSVGVSTFAGVPANVVSISVTIVVFAIPTVVFFTTSVPAIVGSLQYEQQ